MTHVEPRPSGGIAAAMKRRYLDDLGFGSGRAFADALVQSLKPGDRFLDVGCGEGGLRRLMPAGVNYVGIDMYEGPQANEYDSWVMRPDVIGDAHDLPFEDQSFDCCALMHVLEHVEGPDRVMAEISRVLKPGGMFFMDVPFLHEIHHAPNDHYRYTLHGIRGLAQRAGFEVVEVKPSGGYFRAMAHILNEAPGVIDRRGLGSALVKYLVAYPLKLLGFVIGKLQYALDIYDRRQEFTTGYHCIFRKSA